MMDTNLFVYANYFYNFGFNITNITPNRKSFHNSNAVILKSPSHEYKHLQNTRQKLEDLRTFDWIDASGLGMVLGFNNIRALDIDYCNDINIIKAFLKILQLPENYEWVVKSGSENGFHIIFYADEHKLPTEKGKIKAYKPNKFYNNKFKHIELRWIGHLVLPPSMHPSHSIYRFLSNSFPCLMPKKVEIDDLIKLIIKFCRKTSDDDIDVSRKNYYVQPGSTEESFEPSSYSDVFINYDSCFDQYDISKNASEIQENQTERPLFLFFDTETTGLPLDWRSPISNLSNWPRLVQLAWILCDNNGKQIERKDYIIKPEGFAIPKDASDIHGITTMMAIEKGKILIDVLDEFRNRIIDSDYLVAHNIRFDESIVGAEFLRTNLINPIEHKTKICTMLISTEFCELEGPFGYKWPKLSELHYKLFKTSFDEAHNAAADINATAKCFWELKKRGLIEIKDESDIGN